jgi:SAM-dependent methyltransferase
MEKNEYDKMFRFEDWYWWYRGLHELVLAEVRKYRLGLKSAVLDAGCGTGRLMELLQGEGRVEGFDYSPEAVERCRQRGIRACRTMDLTEWEPEEGLREVIISLDVLCCSGVRDDEAALKKFHRALAGGGILILNLPAFPLLRRAHDLAVSSVRRYRKRAFVRQLEALGFRVLYAGYRLPPLFLAMLAVKTLENLSSKKTIESDLRPLPPLINSVLLAWHWMENRLVRRGVQFPFGSSLFVVARKVTP